MGFSLGGFNSDPEECGCCSPPCHWTLTVVVRRCCRPLVTSPLPDEGTGTFATVRYQGPGGIDVTQTVTRDEPADVYDDPAPGTWTITVSAPCHRTETRTVTVEECKSQTLTVTLIYQFTTAYYSDEFGELTLALPDLPQLVVPDVYCRVEGEYTYTEPDSIGPVTCNYGTRCLVGQEQEVWGHVAIEIYPRRDADGVFDFAIYHVMPWGVGWLDCLSIERGQRRAPPTDDCPGGFNLSLRASGTFTCDEPTWTGTLIGSAPSMTATLSFS